MSLRRVAAACALALAAVACTADAPQPRPTASSSSSPSIRTSPSPFGDHDLKYAIIERFGEPVFCDPDSYPVGRPEQPAANEWWAALNKGHTEARSIAAHLGYGDFRGKTLSAPEILRVYREHKRLLAVQLRADGLFEIRIRETPPSPGFGGPDGPATLKLGFVDRFGNITDVVTRPTEIMCPICLDATTLVATPSGGRSVGALRAGDAIWSVAGNGRRVATRVERTARRFVGAALLVRIRLSDGRGVTGSPAHPLPDGRLLGALTTDDRVDGTAVVARAIVPASDGYTYDVRTANGRPYLAGGVPLASTIH